MTQQLPEAGGKFYLEESDITSDVDFVDSEPSTLEVHANNCAKNAGCKSVLHIKMGHTPKINVEDAGYYDTAKSPRGTKKILHRFETTGNRNNQWRKTLKTLVALERPQQELKPDEYQIYRNKLNKVQSDILQGQNRRTGITPNQNHDTIQ